MRESKKGFRETGQVRLELRPATGLSVSAPHPLFQIMPGLLSLLDCLRRMLLATRARKGIEGLPLLLNRLQSFSQCP